MAKERGRRKVRVGAVVSDKMDKTRVVAVPWSQRHRIYGRAIRRLSKFKVHDEENATREGDQVRIVETRPLSKDKRWRIVEILARGEQVDIAPEEVDATLVEEMEQLPKTAAADDVVAEVLAEETEEAEAEEPVAEAEEPAEEEAEEAEEPVAEAEEPAEEEAEEAERESVAEAEEPAAEEAEEAEEPVAEAEEPAAEEAEEAEESRQPKPKSPPLKRRRRPRPKSR